MRIFVSWSGGKDSCLALHRAQGQGFEVSCLLNMVDEDGRTSRSHRLDSELIQAQSRALGIPVLQGRAGPTGYERGFKEAIGELKQRGIEGGVFGDINFNEHRGWIERVCHETGVGYFFPLWCCPEEQLVSELIDSGFEAVIVVARAELFGPEWLGQRVDSGFVEHVQRLHVSPCGEGGEYHTFVVDGPPFRKRLEIRGSSLSQKDGYHFLRITEYGLRAKEGRGIED